FVLPDRIYLFLVSSGGFSLLLTYLVIMLTHLRYRAQFGCPPRGNCQLPGYPYTTWAAIISLIIVIVTMPLIPGQGSGLFAGLVLLGMFAAAYYLFRAGPLASVPAAKPFTGENSSQACSSRKFRLLGFSARKHKQPPDSPE
ncbi:MAG TPA: hypothetical protein PKV15_10520, partial [Syntrophomonadaceae bacterium]|nr:hypothetical protein [Syntrophomonadaceae bacterium]